MSDATKLCNDASVALLKRINQLLTEGYEIWSFWMPYPEKGDKVVVVGTMSFIKYETDNEDDRGSTDRGSDKVCAELRELDEADRTP